MHIGRVTTDTGRIVRIGMAMGHTSPTAITGAGMDHIGRRTGTRINRMDTGRMGISRGGRAERYRARS